MHVRKASLSGAGTLWLDQPDVVKFAVVFAVANFQFALNGFFHVNGVKSKCAKFRCYIDLILK